MKDSATVSQALVEMTKHGFGAVMVVDSKGKNKGVFTDGGLRRGIEKAKSSSPEAGRPEGSTPLHHQPRGLLDEAQKAFKGSTRWTPWKA